RPIEGPGLDSTYECGVEAPRQCPPATVFACVLTPSISCTPILSGVDVVSMNEKGTIAAISHIFRKPPPETGGETFVVPDAFDVEFRTRTGRTIAKQRYTSKKGISVYIDMAPGGGQAFMSWSRNRKCGYRLCHSDSIVDFVGRE